MHNWGDEDVDWTGIEDAAWFIGKNISRWGRIQVSQTKEKYGTVRVYCTLGFSCFHCIIWPRHCWIHQWWPYRLDLHLSQVIEPVVNFVLVPWQRFVYRLVYRLAIRKYPHLKAEILDCADFSEELRGL